MRCQRCSVSTVLLLDWLKWKCAVRREVHCYIPHDAITFITHESLLQKDIVMQRRELEADLYLFNPRERILAFVFPLFDSDCIRSHCRNASNTWLTTWLRWRVLGIRYSNIGPWHNIIIFNSKSTASTCTYNTIQYNLHLVYANIQAKIVQ